MEPLQTTDLVCTMRTATENVFNTMLSLPIVAGEPAQEPAGPAIFDGVVGLIGITGLWAGTGRVACSSRFACQLAGALLMSEYNDVDDDVLDAVAEVTNMIVGNIKTALEDRLGPLGMSTPTVIFGRNYKTRSAGVLQWTVVPFRCNDEVLDLRLCLTPAGQIPPPVRHEHLFM